MLERRHPHITNILNVYAKTILPIIICLSPFFTPDEEYGGEAVFEMKWAFVFFAVISVVELLILLLRWRSIWIYTSEDTLYYERGILAKKKRAIPFNKINTIDLRRNIFERIFGTARMKLDTGAMSENSDDKSEMELVFTLADCEKIRSFILSRNKEDNDIAREAGETLLAENREAAWSKEASFGDFFLYGLTDSSVLKIVMGIIVAITFVGELTPQAYEWVADIAVEIFGTVGGFLEGKSVLVILLLAVISVLVLTVISNIFTIIYAAIRFYGFRAAREGDNIVIRYGLISLKSYTLPVENIHACIVNQNLLQQILGRASVEIVSVGYGNEQNETALLFPIIKLADLPELLSGLLPEYNLNVERKGTNSKSAVTLIVVPLIVWAVFCAAVLVGCSFIFKDLVLVSAAVAVLTVLRVISVILNYRHSALGIGESAISVESGGMHYSKCFVRKDAVQSVTTSTGPLRRKLGLRNYNIHYHAPIIKSNVGVSNLPQEYIDYIDII